MSSATHSASRAMPALPGAHQSFVTSGEAAIFHARACSRPPEPSRRMCIRKPIEGPRIYVGRIKLPPAARDLKAVIPDGAAAPIRNLELVLRQRPPARDSGFARLRAPRNDG